MRRQKPIHQQIAGELRQRILSGRYESSRVPPELRLVEEFGVSRHTIRSALQSLVQDGLIERRAGLGTRVSKRARGKAWAVESMEDLIGEFSIEQSLTLSAELVPARRFPRVAALFGVRKNGKIFHVLRFFPAKNPFLAVSNVFTTAKLAARLPSHEINIKPIIELVERHSGVHASCARLVASAAAADEQVAHQLATSVGDPVLVLHRTYFDADDKPILHTEMSCRPDRYQQTVEFIRESVSVRPERS